MPRPMPPAPAPAADLARLKRYFADSAIKTLEARQHSLTALDYYDSVQYTAAELDQLERRKQPPVVVNRIKPAVNGIIGVAERARVDPRAWPRQPVEADQADVATDILRYIADFNRFKRTKRDCFCDLLVPGSCAVLVGLDADLQVTITQVRWEELFHDPQSRRADFADARYIGICKWMYADDLAAMYPDKSEAIQAGASMALGGGLVADESFQDRPLAYSGLVGWVDPKARRLMVIEMYYREARQPSPDDASTASDAPRGPLLWNRCVFTHADILEEGVSPYQDHKGRPACPIVAMSAYVRRDNARYGAVWDMIPVQDEINKRRSKALFAMVTTRLQVKDPTFVNFNPEGADQARAEAARPDGVIPPGFEMAPNTAEFQANLELLTEAKAELERMGPNPAVLGRDNTDASGRALQARQQAGLIELSNLYGAMEDFELRVWRASWERVKQYWRAPQIIRVTDDENAPRYVGINQPVAGGPPSVVMGDDGMPTIRPGVLGYKNAVAEMDVDIEIDTTPDTATLQNEAFAEIMQLVGSSPVYQQQISLKQLLQLSPIPHKRSILDAIDQASQDQQQKAALAQQLQAQGAQAKIAETQAKAGEHAASGFARSLNALSEAHLAHADHLAGAVESGMASAQPPQAANPVSQNPGPTPG